MFRATTRTGTFQRNLSNERLFMHWHWWYILVWLFLVFITWCVIASGDDPNEDNY